jgi:flagellar hook protein FlgE
MFAGVTGLRNHQVRMDVIGNNIANVNTVAYKASRADFQEAFSQTLRGSSSPSGERGGTNPQQVGLGMTLSSIDVIHTQGSPQMTGGLTDLAIEGGGFFLLSGAGRLVYTRAGNFHLDASGYLTGGGGMRLQGWMAVDGEFTAKDEGTLTSIQIPAGVTVGARATDAMAFGQNLGSSSNVGDSFVKTVDVFDSLGTTHSVVVTFHKTGVNSWSWDARVQGVAAGSGTLGFGSNGQLGTGGTGTVAFTPAGANPVSITVDFGKVTQYFAETTVAASERNGHQMGSLQTFTVDATGVITGVYSNGLNRKLAQVALANFTNPGGLIRSGENNFAESNNSGLRQIGIPGTGGRGMVAPNSLEMSNVDLSLEFTNMILTQRGFQANSRIIGATDEMLQELVNLKR